MLVHIGVAVDPWLPLWWTAVVAWLVARAQFCVSRGCVGSARRRRSTCCWMASLRSRPRPLRPAALLHCLRGSRDASGPRTSVRCRPAASGSTLGASTSLLACGASAAPLGFARRRYGSSAQWRRRQKNRETPVRPPPAGGLVCRRSTSTRRAPPCVLPRASARDALRLLFDRFRSVARASHTGRAMLRTRGCDPPRPASAGPPRTLREPSATTPPRDAQRLRVSSRATAPLACFRTRFPPPLMAARRPAPSGGIVHRSCDAAARGRAPTVSHRCSLRACAASFLTAWRPPRPTQGVPAAQQEPTPSGWSVRAAAAKPPSRRFSAAETETDVSAPPPSKIVHRCVRTDKGRSLAPFLD